MTERITTVAGTLKLHAWLLGSMVAVMWVLEIVDQGVLGGALDAYGIHPRQVDGLAGIAFAPFLHLGFAHLASNTVPFLIFGWLILLHAVRDFVLVTLLAIVVGGVGTWAIGAPGVHIGASGVVFGYFGFLLLRGWFRRSIGSILLSLAVGAAYGGLIFGVLPGQAGISWEGHLFGFAGGALGAYALARRRPARVQLSSSL
jgi:membrane associated rhomboid family serine protease